MNATTIKQQIGFARNAYKMGSLDIKSLDAALDIIEKEIESTLAKPATPPAAGKPLSAAFTPTPPATVTPSGAGHAA